MSGHFPGVFRNVTGVALTGIAQTALQNVPAGGVK